MHHPPFRSFRPTYLFAGALLVAMVAGIPWLTRIAYFAGGYEPALIGTGSFQAFTAHQAELTFRRRYIERAALVALLFLVTSVTGLVLNRGRDVGVPRWVLVVGTAVGLLLTLMGLLIRIVPVGVCC